MRARNVKPGFFDNEKLANLGPYAMLLFAGLWTIADREGRLEDRPQRIKAKIFPYFPKQNVNTLLDGLTESGFIQRYKVGQEQFIAIPKWKKHQNPHVKEVASTLPAPDKNSADAGISCASRADSLIPDSLIPDSSSGTERSGALYERYHEFVEKWPDHATGVDLGSQVWMSLVDNDKITKANLHEVFEGLERWKASAAWEKDGGKYIPAIAKPDGGGWLQKSAWKDRPKPAGDKSKWD